MSRKGLDLITGTHLSAGFLFFFSPQAREGVFMLKVNVFNLKNRHKRNNRNQILCKMRRKK